jgi:hypothetical protein
VSRCWFDGRYPAGLKLIDTRGDDGKIGADLRGAIRLGSAD